MQETADGDWLEMDDYWRSFRIVMDAAESAAQIKEPMPELTPDERFFAESEDITDELNRVRDERDSARKALAVASRACFADDCQSCGHRKNEHVEIDGGKCVLCGCEPMQMKPGYRESFFDAYEAEIDSLRTQLTKERERAEEWERIADKLVSDMEPDRPGLTRVADFDGGRAAYYHAKERNRGSA